MSSAKESVNVRLKSVTGKYDLGNIPLSTTMHELRQKIADSPLLKGKDGEDPIHPALIRMKLVGVGKLDRRRGGLGEVIQDMDGEVEAGDSLVIQVSVATLPDVLESDVVREVGNKSELQAALKYFSTIAEEDNVFHVHLKSGTNIDLADKKVELIIPEDKPGSVLVLKGDMKGGGTCQIFRGDWEVSGVDVFMNGCTLLEPNVMGALGAGSQPFFTDDFNEMRRHRGVGPLGADVKDVKVTKIQGGQAEIGIDSKSNKVKEWNKPEGWQYTKSYKGGWKNGKRYGNGENIWVDKHKYNGGWKDDKRHGHGLDIGADEQKREGMWENDVYIGSASDSPPEEQGGDKRRKHKTHKRKSRKHTRKQRKQRKSRKHRKSRRKSRRRSRNTRR